MQTDIIKYIWDSVVKYAESINEKGIPGLQAWNTICPILKEIDLEGCWTSESLLFYNQLKDLNILEDRTVCEEKCVDWEKHHFLLQHGRIPHNNKNSPSLLRLLQIAFNAGQFNFYREKGEIEYNKERIDFYNKNKLSEYTTYMNFDQIDEKIKSDIESVVEMISKL
jgi:hypothetical protein